MKGMLYFSNLVIPLFLFCVIGLGLLEKKDIYTDFLNGAEEGVKTVAKIMPTLVGLMVAVGVLRASGFLEYSGKLLGHLTERMGFPGELMPLALVRLFSSSAATGLLLDLFKNYGADSAVGWMAALILGATESVVYCMSVYFGSVKIRRTRYTLPGALFASLAGMIAAIVIVRVCGVWV